MSTAQWRCLCGAVEFIATLPSLWVAHCHCTMCQRSGGSAFVTWVGLTDSACRIIDTDQLVHWYASSSGAERGFCSRCGSTLFFRSQRWPGEVHVTLANFEEPVDRAPQVHAFWDTHVDWVVLGDDLPRKIAAEIA